MSLIVLSVIAVFGVTIKVLDASAPPNLIVFVADDLGWDDVGFHGSGQVLTPTIDALASEAVVLDSYYTSPVCSPSRSALLTGVHPVHSSMQHFVIGTAEPRGLSTQFKLLPEYLSSLGYKSHLIGKWHLGFYQEKCTPMRRGFDSHFGYWTGEIGYYDHTALEDKGMWGLDFRDGLEIAANYTGLYTTNIFTEKAVQRIETHNTEDPLFLLMSYQSVHSGNNYSRLEAPERLEHYFPHITDARRRTFASMLLAMDQSIGEIMHALRTRNMLENSIVIFISDNGGAAAGFDGSIGSNWPLRGVKATLWEGGIRVPAFVWSPLLQATPYVSNEPFHVTDWLPTISTAIGLNLSRVSNSRSYKMDGFDQWESLSLKRPSIRKEIIHNIDPIWNVSSIRVGKHKLVQGLVFPNWQGWFMPPLGQHHEKTFVSTRIQCLKDDINNSDAYSDCKPDSSLCLFDIEEDPCELRNIAHNNPQLVQELWQRIQNFAEGASPVGFAERDNRSWPPLHDYAWSCWQPDDQEM